jgi:phosphopantothenate---cysteine ligase (ATP)
MEFVTVQDYLQGLEDLSKAVASSGMEAVFYLAAAVSDFYLPVDKIATHKIQSRSDAVVVNDLMIEGDPLTITLDPVPKLLGMIKVWCPTALAISFKLETDHALLEMKAQASIKKYGVDLVVANLLQTRMDECFMVTPTGSYQIKRADHVTELEELIVNWINDKLLNK